MPRPRTHDDVVRRRLLEYAAALIAERGAAALTLRQVAASAGTSTSAVYTLFGSREQLVRAVGHEAFSRFAGHLAEVGQHTDPLTDLLELGLAYRRGALAEPHFYQVMFDAGPARVHLGPAAAQPTFAVLRAAVQRCLDDGTMHGGNAEAVAFGLWGHVHGLVSLELAGLIPGSAREHAERYEQALRGRTVPPVSAANLSLSATVVVDRPAETVYDMVSDVTRMGEWSPVCTACWWDPGDSARPGAWFTGRNELPERTWETRSRVVVADRGREFAFVVGDSRVRWGYTFEPVGPDRTRVTESWEFLPDGITFFHQRYGADADAQISDRTELARAGLPQTLVALKAAAER